MSRLRASNVDVEARRVFVSRSERRVRVRHAAAKVSAVLLAMLHRRRARGSPPRVCCAQRLFGVRSAPGAPAVAGLPPSTGARIRSAAVGGVGMGSPLRGRGNRKRLDVAQHRVRRLVAVVPALGHRLAHHLVELDGDARAERTRGLVGALQDEREERVVVVRVERPLAGRAPRRA